MRRWFALLALLATTACAPPVGVTPLDVQSAHREMTRSAVATGRPSEYSEQILRRLGLDERFTRDAPAVLAILHEGVATADETRLLALAELSWVHAERGGGRAFFLAAAIYAYALLFPGPGAPPAFHPSDDRLRIAYDLYNFGLAEGLKRDGDDTVNLEAGERALPFGSLDVVVDERDFTWLGYRLEKFVSTDTLAVHGLRNRYRRPGVGVSLAASLAAAEGASAHAEANRIAPRMQVALTAFLRIDEPRAALARGALHGRLELHPRDAARAVTVDGHEYPLLVDPTAVLAYWLTHSTAWEFETMGFRRPGTLATLLKGRTDDGLFLLHPFDPNRVPIVFVHGTVSSPARWAEAINELEADPVLRSRYQLWIYIYESGRHIGYSGGRLRAAIENAVRTLDPGGSSTALRRMIVIGHSQGGLLAKLTAIDSGDRFWRNVSDRPFDSLTFPPETQTLLRDSLFFTPLPCVERLVFIATPHQGSYVAGGTIVRRLTRLVLLPVRLVGDTAATMHGEEARIMRQIERPPNSVDNMNPRSPFIKTLAAIPVASTVTTHSIIAVKGNGVVEEGGDGVVRYTSAHVPGAASEIVVRSSHSVQGNPATIEELRRILREHAALL